MSRYRVTPDWDRAACRSRAVDPDAFFADADGADEAQVTAAAVRVCNGCPIRLGCLAYALRTQQRYGVWGGYTATDRLHLRLRAQCNSAVRLPDARCATPTPHRSDVGSGRR
jgi:hypothetical protein